MSILEHFPSPSSSFVPSTPVELFALMLAARLGDSANATSYAVLMRRHSVHAVVVQLQNLLRQGHHSQPGFFRQVADALQKEDYA